MERSPRERHGPPASSAPQINMGRTGDRDIITPFMGLGMRWVLVWAGASLAYCQSIVTTVAGTDNLFLQDGEPALQVNLSRRTV